MVQSLEALCPLTLRDLLEGLYLRWQREVTTPENRETGQTTEEKRARWRDLLSFLWEESAIFRKVVDDSPGFAMVNEGLQHVDRFSDHDVVDPDTHTLRPAYMMYSLMLCFVDQDLEPEFDWLVAHADFSDSRSSQWATVVLRRGNRRDQGTMVLGPVDGLLFHIFRSLWLAHEMNPQERSLEKHRSGTNAEVFGANARAGWRYLDKFLTRSNATPTTAAHELVSQSFEKGDLVEIEKASFPAGWDTEGGERDLLLESVSSCLDGVVVNKVCRKARQQRLRVDREALFKDLADEIMEQESGRSVGHVVCSC